jgi:hypothetical protein
LPCLKTELDVFRADFMAKASPEVREAMARADAELAASGIAQRALKMAIVRRTFGSPMWLAST